VVGRNPGRKEIDVAEDFERIKDAERVKDAEAQREDPDVEAHRVKQEGDLGATEEGPDVEGHAWKGKVKE
jgi:hypothetical protein